MRKWCPQLPSTRFNTASSLWIHLLKLNKSPKQISLLKELIKSLTMLNGRLLVSWRWKEKKTLNGNFISFLKRMYVGNKLKKERSENCCTVSLFHLLIHDLAIIILLTCREIFITQMQYDLYTTMIINYYSIP